MTIEAAITYARNGYGVFPCSTRSKAPRYRKGSHSRWAPDVHGAAGVRCAAWDPSDVERYWPSESDVAVGLVPPAGVLIVDADEKHRPGIVDLITTAFPELVENGHHRTRSGGAHFPARIPGEADVLQRVDPKLGLDTRVGPKGYVIAPPADGYTVERPFLDVRALAPIPAALAFALLRRPAARQPAVAPPVPVTPGTARLRRYVWSAVQGEHDHVAAARSGSRNSTLHTSAVKLGSLVGAGVLAEEDAREALLAGARACDPPLREWEALRTIDSGIRFGIAHPRRLERDEP